MVNRDEPDTCNLADFATAEDYMEEQKKESNAAALRDTANQVASTMNNEKFAYSKVKTTNFIRQQHYIYF